ncbi:serine/threonine-protein phosphatase 7 long form homolog [Lotus japonicus]|uniref:serine/threonine-protein phosphatase 7 long form homolog n=1 Tax=Lotus japonicus TaxID=34305 RepID=UPI0025904C07|nr:serine/threonine-protein phosphatase 7 long form homolog [Lotus japonicus]
MALATLYDQLGQSSRSGVKQMGGYTSLLLAWVFEHFPDRLIRRYASLNYTEDQPRACRWMESRSGHARLDERRVLLDELTEDDVIWTPYEAHREWRQRDERILFSGYIRCPYPLAVRPHLPERVMRQFGYIHTISRHPSVIDRSSAAEAVDATFADYVPYLFPESDPVIEEGHAVGGYMDWYARVSHCFIIPDERRIDLSAVAALRRALEVLELSFEVDDALLPCTQARALTERALRILQDLAGTQGIAYAAGR